MNAFQLFDALSISFFAILGVWAAVDRRHWFARFAIVGGILLLCLFIPAHELVVTFGLEIILIVAGLWLAEGRKNWRPRLSVETALLAMVVVAVLAAVVARIPDFSAPTWTFHVGAGVFGAFGALVSLWIVAGSARWWVRLVGGVAGVIVFMFMMHGVDAVQYAFHRAPQSGSWTAAWFDYYGSRNHGEWLIAKLPSTALGWAIMLFVLFLGRASGWFGEHRLAEDEPASRTATVARLALCGIVLTVATPLGCLFYRLLTPTPLPAVTLPQPNGFDDFLNAATLVPASLNQLTGAIYATPQPVLEKLSSEIEPIAKLVSDGVEKKCWQPHVFSNLSESQRQSDLMFQVGRALMYRLASLRLQQSPQRVDACLQVIEFGHECSRGSGIYWPPGVYFEVHALSELREMINELDADECRRVALRLRKMDARRDGCELKLARQLILDQHAGWEAHFTQIMNDWSGNAPYSDAVRWCQSGEVNARLLIADFALQAYDLQRGHPPDSLAELVPDYLPEVPRDVFRSAPLCYQRLGGRYCLYSVGMDGVDDGGKPGDALDKTDVVIEGPHKKPWAVYLKDKVDHGTTLLRQILNRGRNE